MNKILLTIGGFCRQTSYSSEKILHESVLVISIDTLAMVVSWTRSYAMEQKAMCIGVMSFSPLQHLCERGVDRMTREFCEDNWKASILAE